MRTHLRNADDGPVSPANIAYSGVSHWRASHRGHAYVTALSPSSWLTVIRPGVLLQHGERLNTARKGSKVAHWLIGIAVLILLTR